MKSSKAFDMRSFKPCELLKQHVWVGLSTVAIINIKQYITVAVLSLTRLSAFLSERIFR